MDRVITERQTYAEPTGTLWVVTCVVPAARQITLRATTGISKIESIDAFQEKVVRGDYQLKTAMSSDDIRRPQDLINLTPNQRAKLDARKRIVDGIQARLNDGQCWDEIEQALQQQAMEANERLPSRRQLHRWVEASRRDQLAPGKPGWPSGRRRYIPEVRPAIEKVVERLNAKGTRELTNLKTLLRLVNAEMRERGYQGQRDALGSRALKQFLAEFKAWGDDLGSYLTRAAHRAITRAASKIMDATRPLELVEIDALIPEFHVFDANGIDIGQPTIYIGIDVATGCILGIKAYAMSPGVEPLLDFYEHMLFPKAARPNGWEPP